MYATRSNNAVIYPPVIDDDLLSWLRRWPVQVWRLMLSWKDEIDGGTPVTFVTETHEQTSVG